MRIDLGKWLNGLLNLISIASIGFVATVWLRHSYDVRSSGEKANYVFVGQTVPLPSVNWQAHAHTLLFALQVGCHFCAENAPFYRELLKHQATGSWQAVAVLPQSVDISVSYMHIQGYSIPTVRQSDLNAVGVHSTPTLLLVDSKGRLEQEWIGALGRRDQVDVAAHLGIADLTEVTEDNGEDSSSYSPLITTSELSRALDGGRRVNVLDIRDRPLFSRGHIAGAINIPLDEIGVRASHELFENAPTFVYCSFSAACDATGGSSPCSSAVDSLARLGIKDVRVIRDPLVLLREGRVSVVGNPDPDPR